jgi:Cu(I)/Ag(I) efflux system membrane protein CusA/SilA
LFAAVLPGRVASAARRGHLIDEREYRVRMFQYPLKLMIVLALFIIFLLMYFNTKSVAYTLIVLLSLPFSAAGAMWLLYLLGYNLSIPVWE